MIRRKFFAKDIELNGEYFLSGVVEDNSYIVINVHTTKERLEFGKKMQELTKDTEKNTLEILEEAEKLVHEMKFVWCEDSGITFNSIDEFSVLDVHAKLNDWIMSVFANGFATKKK